MKDLQDKMYKDAVTLDVQRLDVQRCMNKLFVLKNLVFSRWFCVVDARPEMPRLFVQKRFRLLGLVVGHEQLESPHEHYYNKILHVKQFYVRFLLSFLVETCDA